MLTLLLLPLLKASKPSRVVTVASVAHYGAPACAADWDLSDSFFYRPTTRFGSGFADYEFSKAMNGELLLFLIAIDLITELILYRTTDIGASHVTNECIALHCALMLGSCIRTTMHARAPIPVYILGRMH